MKFKIFLLLFLILNLSCRKNNGNLNVVFEKNEILDSIPFRINGLKIQKKDSVFFIHKNTFLSYNLQDTFKIENLELGLYKLEYIDIIGNKISKEINIKDDITFKIIIDSIDSSSNFNKTPLMNLKNNETYKIEMKGGCVATMYSFYVVEKLNDEYFFEAINFNKTKLDTLDLSYVNKFESELLTINNKDICMSTGRMTYKIIKDGKELEIFDNTCNWNGWGNMFKKIRSKNKK
jgi:hypothetical protein